jgi:ferredoxin
MQNIHFDSTQKQVAADAQCTMCYRCVSQCPTQAITLLGKRVVEQCYLEKYLKNC